ncbi:MAG: indole-3-glycerol-phosphate synthase [Nitriliruptoraceae bacterium]
MTRPHRARAEPQLSTYLDVLLDGARERVAVAAAKEPLDALRRRARSRAPGPRLWDALSRPGVGVIAEVKRASPSKGPIAPALDAAAQARAYQRGGAAAVSVLTEPTRFGGSLADLAEVSATGIATLRKDFIVDPYQIWEARAAGAAAVLLIVAALDDQDLAGLHAEAGEAGLDTLVEVHDEAEAARAAAIGARIVGVNARDLRTFEVDPGAFARLRPSLPVDALAVAESGITTPEQVREVGGQAAAAVLVGESLVRADDPAAAVAALVAAGQAGAASAPNVSARPTVQGSST